jgi:hypothetical protein
MVREEGIDTVEDYLKIIKLNKDLKANKGDSEDFLFRGQKGDHPLIPKIGRLVPKGNLFDIERLLLQEFNEPTLC